MANQLRKVFTDSTARSACGKMQAEFDRLFRAGRVFRGGSNNPDSTAHYGETYAGAIHIDPRVLDGAAAGDVAMLREIALTALHEAGHTLGSGHVATGEPTFDAQGRDYYTSIPFKYLNPGENSCAPR